jgi:hypothetical protein
MGCLVSGVVALPSLFRVDVVGGDGVTLLATCCYSVPFHSSAPLLFCSAPFFFSILFLLYSSALLHSSFPFFSYLIINTTTNSSSNEDIAMQEEDESSSNIDDAALYFQLSPAETAAAEARVMALEAGNWGKWNFEHKGASVGVCCVVLCCVM